MYKISLSDRFCEAKSLYLFGKILTACLINAILVQYLVQMDLWGRFAYLASRPIIVQQAYDAYIGQGEGLGEEVLRVVRRGEDVFQFGQDLAVA